jgi:phospholipid/cholesterol/gamma-HCH transport system ATP-binding protein
MGTVIEFKNFKKCFGTKEVHKDVNFRVDNGVCMGLIGGSGVGKSVLLRSIIGLEKPDSGNVIVEGKDITNYEERDLIEIRKRVAYAFQGGALFDSMTVFENLAYPLREHTDLTEAQIANKISEMLEEFGLQGNDDLYPASLSGGMQKRLGIARAIIMDPPIVLYDEPTAGLDPYNTRKIQEMILRLKARGVTSILVTHDMPSAFAVCDRIAMLMDGIIAAEGSQQDLDSSKGSVIYDFINGKKA